MTEVAVVAKPYDVVEVVVPVDRLLVCGLTCRTAGSASISAGISTRSTRRSEPVW